MLSSSTGNHFYQLTLVDLTEIVFVFFKKKLLSFMSIQVHIFFPHVFLGGQKLVFVYFFDTREEKKIFF